MRKINFRKFNFRSPMMIFLGVLLIFTALLTVRPSVTYACSCVMPAEPLEALEKSTAVFVGKVVDMKEPSQGNIISSADPVKVTFEVDSSWKGVEGNQVTLTTALSSASCGFEFVEGESYIVYAYARDGGESGNLEASLCSRTKRLTADSVDLKELGPGISATTPTASPEVTPNNSPESEAGSNEPDQTGNPAGDSDSFSLVNVGIIGIIIVLAAIAGAVLYRRRNDGTRKK
ncbi:hypothetical protein MHB56_19735 [Paenibacillus sp. FSL H8-0315]